MWEEILNPKPLVAGFAPTPQEFNEAWNWIWTNPNPEMALKIIRNHAIDLSKRHCPEPAKSACVGVWKRLG